MVKNQSRIEINKWYQSFTLRNFDLEDMELESTNSGPTAKLPILKLGEYKMWGGLTFSQYPDAKSMFAAIETRFGGNAATKKTQKTLLKQQYENFSATSALSKFMKIDFGRGMGGGGGGNRSEVATLFAKCESKEALLPGSAEHQEQGRFCSEIMTKQEARKQRRHFQRNTKRGLDTVEAQLVTYRKNEVLFSEEVVVLKREVGIKQYEINMLKTEFEKVKQEKDGIEFKIEKFDKASKDLDQLLESQITDKSKKGLGYSAVPPPHPLIYNRPNKLDLSYSGLDEFKEPEFKGYGLENSKKESNVVCEKESVNSRKILTKSLVKEQESQVKSSFVEGCGSNTSKNVSEVEPKKVRKNNDAPIIEDWVSDDEEQDESMTKPERNWHSLTDDKGFVGQWMLKAHDDTECLVLSPNFKLPDENQILLKVPRKDNMYSFDMKNIVPKESLTCLVAKATLDESMLWHRRLGHINFKNINKLVKDNLDETSEILKNFIKVIENLVDKKVKIIRSDNGTEFKNKVMDDFCREKGIKREYSVARTPQQNGVAERRNRTLIEAARTISKAFRVYNTRTRRVEENLHIGFLENKPMIEGNGPKWLFDIDSLTQSMNYVPVAVGIISNESAGTQGELNAGTSTQKEEISQDCIVMPIWKDASYFESPSKDVGNSEPNFAADDQKQVEDGLHNESDEKDKSEYDSSPKEVNAVGQHVNTASPEVNTGRFKLNTVDPSVNIASLYELDSPKDMFKLRASHTLETTHVEFFSDEDEPEVDLGNITNSYTVPTTPNTRIHKDHPIKNVIGDVKSTIQTRRMTKSTSKQGFLSAIEPTSIAKALFDSSWVEAMQEELLKFKLQQGHRQEKGIDYEEVFAPMARIEAIRLFLAYASFMGFLVYQMDVKSAFLYGTIEEEVYVTQPPRFKDPDHPDKVYKVVKVYVDDIIFGSTNKELCTAFQKLIKDKFQMSSIGEFTFFLGLQVTQKEDGIFISQDKYVAEILKKFNYIDVKSASTPVDLKKPLVKDGDADDVDVHPYSSMIGSLIYLKGKPTLGLWYSRDSPFELVAYNNSDYAGATQDRKFTTAGCQFLGNRLISWQCKKQTVVTTSTTEAEYVATASCCGQ
ncbi:putative ribonuclease H-like domain-containing protein, partial [Tanacetum coccineum]